MSQLHASIIMAIILVGCGADDQPAVEPVKTAAVQPVVATAVEPAMPVAIEQPIPESVKSLTTVCDGCHVNYGAENSENIPFITGQQPEYFKAALRAYITGDRKQEEMKSLLGKLSDNELDGLSRHYASLKQRWEPAKKIAKHMASSAIDKKLAGKGKKVSGSCIGCHGQDGNSMLPGVPSLAGLQADYLKSSLKSYLTGYRSDKIMTNFRKSISENNVNNLAAYYASLPRAKSVNTIKGSSKAGQKIAEKSCAGCHGYKGNSINQSIPDLSGQDPEYLVKSLRAYRDGGRKNAMMLAVTKKLSNQHINNLAAFYSGQKPEAKALQSAKPTRAFDPVSDGQRLAQGCNGCHGANGNSDNPDIPRLSGQNPEYLSSSIRAYKTGERQHEVMKSFVASSTDTGIESIALYYATQQPVSQHKTATAGGQADPLVATCSPCHGQNGISTQPGTPNLAGQNLAYLSLALNQYKSGKRKNEGMINAVKDINTTDLQKIATYYVNQTPQKPEITLPQSPLELAEKCDRCHGSKGHSTVQNIPRLASQAESYLKQSLDEYKSGARQHSGMNAMTTTLGKLEIANIARYYSQQK